MRWFLMPLAATTLCGCFESRALEAEKKAAEATMAVGRYEADEVRPLQDAVQAMKAELATRESEASQSAARLASLRQELASLWRGDEAQMRAKARAASVPANLLPFLEKAQSEAGTSTLEQRFKAAIGAGDLGALGVTVSGWERGLSPEVASPPVTEEKCEREKVSLSCETLATDESPAPTRFLCRARGRAVTFVASDEDGDLAIRRLEPEAPGAVRVVRRLGPDWWVIRRELTEKTERLSADRGIKVVAKRWIGLVQLSESAATERLAVAAEASGKAIAFVPVDLDSDGVEELVEIAPDLVRAVHYGPKSGGVELWPQEDTCRRLASRTEAPLASAQAACAETLRRVKEAEQAAAKLAADIQRAPPPSKTLEALRDALLACELPKARALVTARLADDLERRAKEQGESVDVAFQKVCSEVKALAPRVTLGKTELKGARAVVELSVPETTCSDCFSVVSVPLSFVEGSWKAEAGDAR